jgi:hypothetical protein
MTKKFIKGEIVKILESQEKKYIGKFGEIIYIADIQPRVYPYLNNKGIYFMIKLFHKEKGKISANKLFFRNQISHISKKMQEEFLAKELAEKL